MSDRSNPWQLQTIVSHMRHTWQEDQRYQLGEPQQGADLASDLERIIAMHGGDSIAACFVEPIAGSIGVYVPPAGYLKRLREICDKHGILLVFDEVITGFGRTGKAFAAQSFAVKPDLITMAKALTNGAIPMGAVAVDESVYDTVINASKGGGPELFHGYTYSGHPVANYGMPNHLRITIGLPAENTRLLEALSKVLARG